MADLTVSLLVFALLAAELYAVSQMWGAWPWFAWIVFAPFAFLIGSVLGLLGLALFGNFLATLKPTNWLAYVDPDGLWLNLRSYKNGHFEGDDPTVVFLRFDELESVRQVTEVRREQRPSETRTNIQRTLELRLAGASTESLAVACTLERDRKAPSRKKFGSASSTKHHVAPVFVPEPGVVRVAWRKDLFEALGRHVATREPVKIDLNERLAGGSAEVRARALVRRGQRFAALRIALEELDLDAREAKEWLATLERRAA